MISKIRPLTWGKWILKTKSKRIIFLNSIFSRHRTTAYMQYCVRSGNSHNSKLNANINTERERSGGGSGLMCSCPKALSVFDKICVTRLSTIVVSKPHLYFITGCIREKREQNIKHWLARGVHNFRFPYNTMLNGLRFDSQWTEKRSFRNLDTCYGWDFVLDGKRLSFCLVPLYISWKLFQNFQLHLYVSLFFPYVVIYLLNELNGIIFQNFLYSRI